MRQYEENELNEYKKSIDDFFIGLIGDANSTAVEFASLISEVNEKASLVENSITVLSDMMTDLFSINGMSKTIRHIVNCPVLASKNIELDIDNDIIKLKKRTVENITIDAEKCIIASDTRYKLLKYSDNSSIYNLETMFRYGDAVTLQFYTEGPQLKINMPFNRKQNVNQVTLKFLKKTKDLPEIHRMYYIDSFGNEQDIDIISKQNLKLEDDRKKDNIYIFETKSIFTDNIVIELSIVTNRLEIESVSVDLVDFYENGEIVFGPISSSSSILKCSLDANGYSTNTKFSVSHDKDFWTEINPVNSLSLTNLKILSYNTKNNDSVKTNKDITKLYFKIEMKGKKESDSLKDFYLYSSEQKPASNILEMVEDNKYSLYVKDPTDLDVGLEKFFNICNLRNKDIKKVERILNEKGPLFLGLIDTPITASNTLYSVAIKTKPKKLDASLSVDASEFNLETSEVFQTQLIKLTKECSVKSEKVFCIPICCNEDVYKISTEEKEITIDLRLGYVKNSTATVIIVPDEDIKVSTETGNLLASIPKNNLKTITIEGTEYKYLDLMGILYHKIEIEGKKLNQFYPIVPIKYDEYAIEHGKIITSTTVVKGDLYELSRKNLSCSKSVNYSYGNFITVNEDYHFQREQLYLSDQLQTEVKLKNVSIVPGSIEIELVPDDINTYMPEEELEERYINIGTKTNPILLLTDENNTEYLKR